MYKEDDGTVLRYSKENLSKWVDAICFYMKGLIALRSLFTPY